MLRIAPFCAVKTLEKAEGSFVLSCLNAQSGSKNGGGKKGIAMELNTEPIQYKTKFFSDKWTYPVNLGAAGHC